MTKEWPKNWPATLNADPENPLTVALPLVTDDKGFSIYALDLMGRAVWNEEAARALAGRLAGHDFDIILTAESKAIALAQELSRQLGMRDYVVLRKSLKLYMHDPVVVDVKSITTKAPQKFYLGEDQVALLRGRRVCVVDDVISTGGTMHAIFDMAKNIGFQVTVIAVVLVEEQDWQEFDGVPVLSLGRIPLPGASGGME
jgi:adenine phosphoribosyltransferase